MKRDPEGDLDESGREGAMEGGQDGGRRRRGGREGGEGARRVARLDHFPNLE